MKKFKSLISLLLVLGMLLTLWAAPVHAADRITVSGTDVTVNPPGSGNYTIYGSFIIFGKGKAFEYTMNVPEDGQYHISVDIKIVGDAVVKLEGASEIVELSDATDDRKEKYVGKLGLKAGDNLLSFTCTGGTAWLYKIYAEKASDKTETNFARTEGAYKNYYLPAVIEAEDYDIGSNGSYSMEAAQKTDYRGEANLAVIKNTEGKNVISLRASEWANYTFNVSHGGSYNLSVKTNTKGSMEFYFDDYPYPILASIKDSETIVANVYLEEGEHVLKMKSADTMFEVDYISLTSASEKGYSPEELATRIPTAEELEALKNEDRPVWKEIWVSSDSGEAGTGSKDNPFKTIDEAKEYIKTINHAMSGDIVVRIMPGEYTLREMLVFDETDGGKNGYRVIWQGANALERPVISGGTRITNWEPHENGVWKASVPYIGDMRTLYINGFAAQRARSKYIYNFGAGYDDPDTPEPIDGYTVSKLNFPDISNVSEAEIAFNQLWTVQRAPVKEIIDAGGTDCYVVCDQPHFYGLQTNYNNDITPLPGSKGYLENAYELIDEPGEFYFNKFTKTLYYYPFAEENLKTAEVVAGTTEFMFQIMGTSKESRIEGICFDNIDFRYGTWLDVNRTGLGTFQADCLIDENNPSNKVQSNGRTMPAVIQIRRARDINITNCNFQNLGASAIFMDEHVTDSVVDGNVFHDISGTAVSVGTWRHSGYQPEDLCENIDITNNVMHRIGLDYYGSPAVGVYYARRINTEHNDIKDTPYSGITYGWGWGSKVPIRLDSSGHSIRYNRIVDNSNTVKDGGPIYTLGEMKNTFIEYNHLTDSRDFGGIYFDSGSAMMTCRYNVLEDMKQSSIFGAGGTTYGLIIKSNWANIVNKRQSFKSVDSEIELPVVYENKDWPEEALAVIENAGLERGYRRLLAGLEYPEWRTAFWENENSVNDFYKSVNILEKHSTEWMEGGEGVAYHEKKEGTTPKVYDLGLNISVGDTSDGEWLAYEVDVAKEGDYQLELVYSYLSSSKDDNVSTTAGINLYVDGEKVMDRVMLEGTGSWQAYLPFNVGKPFRMTAGRHIIKVEFVNAWSFEKFRLINTEFTETEPEFDDGVMLRKEGAQ